VKLADAGRSGRALSLATARRTPWRELPWWSDGETAADRDMVATGVRALFQVNVISGCFQTHPSEPPGGRLTLDVENCRIAAAVRPNGVFAEPARWLFPPCLARRLHERGARRVEILGAARVRIAEITAALLELVDRDGGLPSEVSL
jgi:hypothetical protein